MTEKLMIEIGDANQSDIRITKNGKLLNSIHSLHLERMSSKAVVITGYSPVEKTIEALQSHGIEVEQRDIGSE